MKVQMKTTDMIHKRKRTLYLIVYLVAVIFDVFVIFTDGSIFGVLSRGNPYSRLISVTIFVVLIILVPILYAYGVQRNKENQNKC